MAQHIVTVTPFEKMPWGYTVTYYLSPQHCSWLIFVTKGIFELENGGGLFGMVSIPFHFVTGV